MMEQNQREIDLLRDNPGQFIVSYQPLIQIIVRVFVRSRQIRDCDHDEVISYINEKLLLKIERIRSQYNGVSMMRTYMSTVIRNLCLEKIRESHSGLVEEPSQFLEYAAYSPANQLNDIVIRQELQRLTKVMISFGSDRQRLEFCLKVMYRIPVTKEEFCSIAEGLNTNKLSFLWNSFNLKSIVEERDQYLRLTTLFTLIDGNKKSRDSIRKWIHHRLHQVISLMNGNPKRADYNEETVQLLFERYFTEDYQLTVLMNENRGYQNAKK